MKLLYWRSGYCHWCGFSHFGLRGGHPEVPSWYRLMCFLFTWRTRK